MTKESAMRRHFRHILVLAAILMLAPALSGCIIEEGRGPHCGYWHRCD